MQLNRREWLALGGLAISAACGRKKATGYPGFALVATAGENSLAVVDLTSFKLLPPIPLGAPPGAVATGSAGSSYVLTPSNGSVHLLDADLRRVTSRRFADQLSQIRVTPDGNRIIALATENREFIEADARTLQVRARHKLDTEPVTADVSGDSLIALSSGAQGVIYLFSLKTGQRNRIQMPGPIGDIRFRADGQLLLAANFHDRSLTALSVPRLEIIADLPLAMQPQNLCFNADQGQLFVTGEGMDGLAIVFPYNTLEVEQTVLAGRDPGVMACSANPPFLFVASHSGSDVCIVDVDTRKVIGLVDAGLQPTYIVVTPDSQYALVLNGGASMAVIRVAAIQQSSDAGYNYRQKSGGSLFAMLDVGERPVHAAVIPFRS